jgi:hypothetical protein
MQYFLLHSQIHINHFDSVYPFRSVESLVTSLDVIYIMFELSIKNLSTADTTLSLGHPRALTGAAAYPHQVVSPLLLFITAVPNTKLCAWGGGG